MRASILNTLFVKQRDSTELRYVVDKRRQVLESPQKMSCRQAIANTKKGEALSTSPFHAVRVIGKLGARMACQAF